MIQNEQYEFDQVGRMKFHPDFHPNTGKRFSEEEYEYLCKFACFDGLRSVAFALGRTEVSIQNQLQILMKQGKFGYYKRLDKYYV